MISENKSIQAVGSCQIIFFPYKYLPNYALAVRFHLISQDVFAA